MREIRLKQPNARILLHAILPRGDNEDKAVCCRLANERLKGLSDGQKIVWIDLSSDLLGTDGKLKRDLYAADGVHFKLPAYRLWRERLEHGGNNSREIHKDGYLSN